MVRGLNFKMSYDILKGLEIFILRNENMGQLEKLCCVFEELSHVLGLFCNPRRQNQPPLGGNCSETNFSLHLYNLCESQDGLI